MVVIILIIINVTCLFAGQIHVVKPGESIVDIAAMYDTTPLELAVVNNLNLNEPIVEGAKLMIIKIDNDPFLAPVATPTTHKIVKGENLYTVSKKYGIPVQTLASINNIKANTKLKPGKIIKLVSDQLLTVEAAENLPGKGNQTLVNLALTLKGTRYVSGGTSRGGFDCSGLTSYVYAQMGKKIPRTSAMQYRGGQVVAPGDLQKGDIVCFTTRRAGCSHVGIYIGGGKFIHAATHNKGVIISSLSDKYYSARYLGARRY